MNSNIKVGDKFLTEKNKYPAECIAILENSRYPVVVCITIEGGEQIVKAYKNDLISIVNGLNLIPVPETKMSDPEVRTLIDKQIALEHDNNRLKEIVAELDKTKTITKWAQDINLWAGKKGWNSGKEPNITTFALHMMNYHAEISEAWEELRKGKEPTEVYYSIGDNQRRKPEGFGIELADLIIRVLHTCSEYGIPIEENMVKKMEYNWNRSYRHGGKLA